MTLALHMRVEYVNIDCEMNQSEYGLSYTAVKSWFNSPNLGGLLKPSFW